MSRHRAAYDEDDMYDYDDYDDDYYDEGYNDSSGNNTSEYHHIVSGAKKEPPNGDYVLFVMEALGAVDFTPSGSRITSNIFLI